MRVNSCGSAGLTADNTWSGWSTLTAPSGGWTFAKIAALELIMWAGAGMTLAEFGVVQPPCLVGSYRSG